MTQGLKPQDFKVMEVFLSKKFSLIGRDYLRAAGMTAISAILTAILEVFQAGSLDFDWVKILSVGLTAGIGYLIKNGLFEPNKVITEVPKDVSPEAVTQEIKNTVS